MNYKIGDRVMYSNYGVCSITAFEERPDIRNPENTTLYYVLEPFNKRLGKVFLPASRVDALRPALTREEALRLIDSVSTITVDDFNDKSYKVIEEHFRSLLRTGTVENLVCVVKSMHSRINKQSELGKNPSASYLHLKKEAETRFHSEIAYALDIEEDEVADFIASRVAGKAE